jgi:hypothetical protein
MKSKKILAKLLYYGLTEIRAKAKETKNNDIFVLARFLTNLPLELSVAKTEEDYDNILAKLEEASKTNAGLQSFIKQVTEKKE